MSDQGTLPFKENRPADIHGTHSHITHSDVCRSGDMKCADCGQKIKGEYLIVEHYCSARGNEDDYAELFHRECSANNNTWKKHDKEVQETKENNLKTFEKNKRTAIEMITNMKYIEGTLEIYEDDDTKLITINRHNKEILKLTHIKL